MLDRRIGQRAKGALSLVHHRLFLKDQVSGFRISLTKKPFIFPKKETLVPRSGNPLSFSITKAFT
jgi:hypothetical protein